MTPEQWASTFNEHYKAFDFSFKTDNDAMRIMVQETSLVFPYEENHSNISPSYFFKKTHSGGEIYEPLFVAWLLFFSKYFKENQVAFYDLGSLFGYFSTLASRLFKETKIIAVEPNPQSVAYIRRAFEANQISNFQIHEVFLDDEECTRSYLIGANAGIVEWPGWLTYGVMRLREIIRNALKRAVNMLRGTTYETYRLEVCDIRTQKLTSILLPDGDDLVEIMKIDAEGAQAMFLPHASSTLIDRSVILMLEFDETEKMASFGSSNAELVQPFLEQGYALLWCNHRDKTGDVIKLDAVGPEQERNSLGVLIPPKYLSE